MTIAGTKAAGQGHAAQARFGAELLGAMIAGIRSDPPWQAFVDGLRDQFDVVHANIIFRHPVLEQNHMTESNSPEIAAHDRTGAYDRHGDPIPYFQMRPFKAYRLTEFVDSADHPFIARFLAPYGMGSVLICRVTTITGMQAWLSLARSTERGFAAVEVEGLEALAVLFEQALALFGEVNKLEDERDVYRRLARARPTGIVRVDYRGAVLHMDDNARAWTGQGTGQEAGQSGLLTMRGGRLQAVDPADCRRLDKALANILSGASDEELITFGPAGEGLEMLLLRTTDPLEPAHTHAPRAIVYLRPTGLDQAPSLQRLGVLFGLSRREAMLAGLLVRGLTVAEAARDLGISEQTARTYLRQVFEKTGITRQAELIRKLQASIATVV